MTDPYESLRLDRQVCVPLYLCSKEITRKYTPLLKALDLTYTQYIVMMFLWEHKKACVSDIGKVLLLDSGTLTPILKKLEAKGYVTRTRSTLDERNLDIRLTDKGLALRDRALSVPAAMANCVSLTPQEAMQLLTLIGKILNHIEKE